MPNQISINQIVFVKLFFLFLAYTLVRLTLGINQNYIHLTFVTLVILHTPLLSNLRSVIGNFSNESFVFKVNPFVALLSASLVFLLYYLRLPSWINISRFDQSVIIFILFTLCSILLRLNFTHSITIALFMLVLSASSKIYSLPHISITSASLSYLLIGYSLIQHFYRQKYENK